MPGYLRLRRWSKVDQAHAGASGAQAHAPQTLDADKGYQSKEFAQYLHVPTIEGARRDWTGARRAVTGTASISVSKGASKRSSAG